MPKVLPPTAMPPDPSARASALDLCPLDHLPSFLDGNHEIGSEAALASTACAGRLGPRHRPPADLPWRQSRGRRRGRPGWLARALRRPPSTTPSTTCRASLTAITRSAAKPARVTCPALRRPPWTTPSTICRASLTAITRSAGGRWLARPSAGRRHRPPAGVP